MRNLIVIASVLCAMACLGASLYAGLVLNHPVAAVAFFVAAAICFGGAEGNVKK